MGRKKKRKEKVLVRWPTDKQSGHTIDPTSVDIPCATTQGLFCSTPIKIYKSMSAW